MFMVTIIASRLHGPENTTYKGIKQEMRWRRGCTGVLVMLSISCVTCHVIQMFRASDLASKKKNGVSHIPCQGHCEAQTGSRARKRACCYDDSSAAEYAICKRSWARWFPMAPDVRMFASLPKPASEKVIFLTCTTVSAKPRAAWNGSFQEYPC